MRIGLDFDNTLACYHQVFGQIAREQGIVSKGWKGGKTELRSQLRSYPEGELLWQRIQGLVYGKYMHRATMFPEVANFLLRLKAHGIKVSIVSHKTEFGHHDPEKVPLRHAALNWLENQKFFGEEGLGLSRESVYFSNTREEKVQRINHLKCDAFIDDLWEVFAEPTFPETTKKILFGEQGEQTLSLDFTSQSWREIGRYLLEDETEQDVQTWIEYLAQHRLDGLTKVKGRANSQVYRVQIANKDCAVKWYPDLASDSRQRLLAESQASKFLREQGVEETLQFMKSAPELNLAMYGWIEGTPVQEVRDEDVVQALRFTEKLYQLRKVESARNLPKAAEACLSLEDLQNQITRRSKRLLLQADDAPRLREFLDQDFSSIFEQCQTRITDPFYEFPQSNPLAKSKQTLSPSDFGFHNALRTSDGALVWLDFEYFGWDDPVKLISDFLWHPGFELNSQQQELWKRGCFDIFKQDPELQNRFDRCFPLYGLRWSLILLNSFLRGKEESEECQQQLQKAQQMLSKVREILSITDRN